MRLNTNDFLRKAQHPLLMGVGSFPVSMLLTLSFAPDRFRFAWCFPAAFVLLSWLSSRTMSSDELSTAMTPTDSISF